MTRPASSTCFPSTFAVHTAHLHSPRLTGGGPASRPPWLTTSVAWRRTRRRRRWSRCKSVRVQSNPAADSEEYNTIPTRGPLLILYPTGFPLRSTQEPMSRVGSRAIVAGTLAARARGRGLFPRQRTTGSSPRAPTLYASAPRPSTVAAHRSLGSEVFRKGRPTIHMRNTVPVRSNNGAGESAPGRWCVPGNPFGRTTAMARRTVNVSQLLPSRSGSVEKCSGGQTLAGDGEPRTF